MVAEVAPPRTDMQASISYRAEHKREDTDAINEAREMGHIPRQEEA